MSKSKKPTSKSVAKARAKVAKEAHPAPVEGTFILREPNAKDEIKLPREGSKRHLVMSKMKTGATIADLMKITGWAESACRGFFNEDCRKVGVGVKRVTKDGVSTYFAIMPKGVSL